MAVRLLLGLTLALAAGPLVARFTRRAASAPPPRSHIAETIAAAAVAGAAVALWAPAVIAVGAAFVLLGIPAAAVDAAEHRIPDMLSFPLCGATVTCSVAAAVAGQDVGSGVRALAGGAVWGLLLMLSYLLSGQPGPGDVKLAPSVGVLLGWLGWSWVLGGLIATYLLTALAGVLGVVRRRYSFRTGQVPMGPPMVAVALACGTLAQW
ncbi:prepilin peptidase [Amycolatopsis pretoriensis]|uniref:prepilin peptidase n=1 Tax=Amycolatopsis pretoriensis TaxID=218821 RepID=UPI001FC8F64A|nr:prepilin peptidase [Amycolatopsis pretoriensis]